LIYIFVIVEFDISRSRLAISIWVYLRISRGRTTFKQTSSGTNISLYGISFDSSSSVLYIIDTIYLQDSCNYYSSQELWHHYFTDIRIKCCVFLLALLYWSVRYIVLWKWRFQKYPHDDRILMYTILVIYPSLLRIYSLLVIYVEHYQYITTELFRAFCLVKFENWKKIMTDFEACFSTFPPYFIPPPYRIVQFLYLPFPKKVEDSFGSSMLGSMNSQNACTFQFACVLEMQYQVYPHKNQTLSTQS